MIFIPVYTSMSYHPHSR